VILLVLCPLYPLTPLADESGAALTAPGSDGARPPEEMRWLDEVRAQREAWEARRKAAKAQSDAHLRMLDPIGAAHIEEREKESERMREAVRERAEQQRHAMEQEREARRQELEQWLDQRRTMPYPYTPYDLAPSEWNNPWFYRGY